MLRGVHIRIKAKAVYVCDTSLHSQQRPSRFSRRRNSSTKLSVLSQSPSNPRTSKLIRMRVTLQSFSFLMARAFGGDPKVRACDVVVAQAQVPRNLPEAPLSLIYYSSSPAIFVCGLHRENVDDRRRIPVRPSRCKAHLSI